MNVISHLRSRPWIMAIIAIGLIASHVAFFYLLRHAAMPHTSASAAIMSGIALLILGKHLGLLAALPRWLHRLFRRRPPT